MNSAFKNINIEDVLFFDTEVVRKSEHLDINSKEFQLYQKKIRNKETGELLPNNEVIEHYNKNAALKIGFNKVVCATTGKVIDGVLYLRSFIGGEEEILRGLFSKYQTSKYIAGFNIIGYDMPVTRVNSLRYEGVSQLIPEGHNDSGKKSWSLEKSVIELMDVFKGTHYSNSSLEEVCYHLGIESPKAEIDGSQVSEIYYSEGVEAKIEPYAKKDVHATVNVFCKLQGKPIFETYVDANQSAAPIEKELTVLEKLYNTNTFSAEIKTGLEKLLKKKKITEKDKEKVKEIIVAHALQKIDVMDYDAVKKEKTKSNDAITQETDEWIKIL